MLEYAAYATDLLDRAERARVLIASVQMLERRPWAAGRMAHDRMIAVVEHGVPAIIPDLDAGHAEVRTSAVHEQRGDGAGTLTHSRIYASRSLELPSTDHAPG